MPRAFAFVLPCAFMLFPAYPTVHSLFQLSVQVSHLILGLKPLPPPQHIRNLFVYCPTSPLGTREQRCVVLLFMAESTVPSVVPGTEWLSMRSCLVDDEEQVVVPIGATHRNVSTWHSTLLSVLLSFLNVYVILLWKKILNEKWCLAMSWSRTGHICRAPVVCMTCYHLQSAFLDTATLDLHGVQR